MPDKYKFNLVFNLIYRIYRIATNMAIFDRDFMSLKDRLVRNGFPENLILSCVNRVLSKYHLNTPTNHGQQIPTVGKRQLKD